SGGFLAWSPQALLDPSGFKADYFEPLAALEAKNFWFCARNALIVWMLRTYAPFMSSFMEIGCGTGFVLKGIAQEFPKAHLVGSELFPEGLAFAASRLPKATFLQLDAREMPFFQEFDGIGAFDVLEHIEEDDLVLENVARALKPGGVFLISVPQHAWLWSAVDEYACHVRRYCAKDLHFKLYKAGFDIVRSTSFTSLLLPAMILSRRKATSKEVTDPLKELRLLPLLNYLFTSILTLERFMIQLGLNLPIGGSRFVVAKKRETS
ncbi:MAG: class I SAM-dependent methyltransferase, partial [Holosporales bacterium]|nr:class I SAM-dependent methyltransferase [Holosporales bacterium]